MSDPRDDYLWDPQQMAVPELQALEAALASLRHRTGGFDATRRPTPRGWRKRGPWLAAVLALAAALLVAWLWCDDGLAPGAAPRRLHAGAAAQRFAFGDLADVELQPGTELQFEHWRADELRLQLVRGAIGVRVASPPAVAPRFFRVDTPRGAVIDLGCRYELRARSDGSEDVRVTEGAVEFALPQRTVFVPAGAGCRVVGDRPATPTFADTEPKLLEAVAKFDAMPSAVAADDRVEVATMLVDRCVAGRDTLVLWHLLRDPEAAIRNLAEARLLDLEGTPPGAVEGVAKGDPPHAEPEVWLPFLRQGAWSTAR